MTLPPAAPAAPSVAAAQAWIGLGANLGDAATALREAATTIAKLPGTAVEAASPLYRSAPVDASGPDYLNAVLRLRTTLAPLALLHALQHIEQAAGRERPYRNAPRTLDLDVLIYLVAGRPVELASAELTLPHPRMAERAFVLHPLADIDPALVPATLLQGVADQRLERLPDAQQWPR